MDEYGPFGKAPLTKEEQEQESTAMVITGIIMSILAGLYLLIMR